jgi:hypothetical protein
MKILQSKLSGTQISLSTSFGGTTYIFTALTCTTTIISLKPCAWNAEFQHFIMRFNKISLLCKYHWKEGTRGWKHGPTQSDFTYNSNMSRVFWKILFNKTMGAMSKLESFSRTIFCFILISLWCLTSWSFSFCNEPIWLVHHKKMLILWKILWEDEVPAPLAHQYRWEREDFGQNIWDESEVLLGTPLGNTLGT